MPLQVDLCSSTTRCWSVSSERSVFDCYAVRSVQLLPVAHPDRRRTCCSLQYSKALRAAPPMPRAPLRPTWARSLRSCARHAAVQRARARCPARALTKARSSQRARGPRSPPEEKPAATTRAPRGRPWIKRICWEPLLGALCL